MQLTVKAITTPQIYNYNTNSNDRQQHVGNSITWKLLSI